MLPPVSARVAFAAAMPDPMPADGRQGSRPQTELSLTLHTCNFKASMTEPAARAAHGTERPADALSITACLYARRRSKRWPSNESNTAGFAVFTSIAFLSTTTRRDATIGPDPISPTRPRMVSGDDCRRRT